MANVDLLYFAWVRERIGLAEEHAELPEYITTISELLDWLEARGENYASALSDRKVVRVALDKNVREHHEPLGDAREIALFPPMTGG